MGETKAVNRLKDKAPSLVPVSEMSNREVVNEVKKWWKPNTKAGDSTEVSTS